MAKSLEDTAFYRFHRLIALNEVGGNPAAGAMQATQFHALMQARVNTSPHGMTATATHDTKRGEDARTRILALAEIPNEWTNIVGRWKLMNAPHVITQGEMRSPSVAFEYMFYQALVGAWPLKDESDFVTRMQAYALKAAREGKQETSWLNPNLAYEKGLEQFIAGILDPASSADFISSVRTLMTRISLLGALYSLSQITLKATLPGVPDFYQGTESWDFSLVDPDNRRPVDFGFCAGALPDVEPPDWNALKTNWSDGRIKLALTRQLLRLRSKHESIFTDGQYAPLTVRGEHSDDVLAFARMWKRQAVIVAVARRFAPATDGGRHWPEASFWHGDVDVTGYEVEHGANGRLPLAAAFADLPIAVRTARRLT